MLILDDKYYWQICAKGHSMLHEPGKPYDVCKICNRDIVLGGVIDEKLPNADKKWDNYFAMVKKTGQDWIDTYGDDGEILSWVEGTIITHRDCGGLGVVCTCPADEFEPPESYVRWVVIPDWSLPTKEVTPQSVWLSSRNNSFKKANAIRHSDVVS